MKISQIGEFGLIDRIKKTINNPIIGDDTAPIYIDGKTFLATTDSLIEGQHFLKKYPPAYVGFKAVSVNVSDIVASGGKPKFLLISLMAPNIKVSYIDKLYQGIVEASKFYKCKVIGGNISFSKTLALDIFLIGKTDKFISRRSATPGDSVFITGFLGDSKAGLELLLLNKKKYLNYEKILIDRHLRPVIDINNADYISTHATSSLDISDGLSSDIFHISKSSKVKIVINKNKLPISSELVKYCNNKKVDPLKYALSGGEDYQILFTQKKSTSPFTKIGSVKKGVGVFLDQKPLRNQSFDHFKIY